MKEGDGETPKHRSKRSTGDRRDKKKERRSFRPRTTEQFQSAITTATSDIRNKQKRLQIRAKRKAALKAIKDKARKQRKQLPQSERQQPITIEDKQFATEGHLVEEHPQHQIDEFNNILNNKQQAKILLTTSEKPSKRLYDFLKQLMVLFPSIFYYPRQKFTLPEIYGFARNMKYSHVMVVRDAVRRWQLLLKKLDGGSAHFKITNIKLSKDISHHGLATEHRPQLILNNFNSKMGVRVGRMLSSLFPADPEFRGRRVVTFHNQRDFIFVRHHRYIFKDEFTRVGLQEIGPRFTLRLQKLYQPDSEAGPGELEFQTRDDMYVQRSKILL